MMDKDSLTAVYTVYAVQYAVRTLVFQPICESRISSAVKQSSISLFHH